MNQKAYNYRPMQLNRQILQSPVVLFLGAGASQSLDKLTMKPFVERLPARIKYRPDPVKKALQHLIEHCGDDLENILGELDAIIHLKSATSVSMIREGGSRSISQDVANSVRHAIEYDIIREYAEVPLEKVTRLYRPLFDLIFARIDPQVHCLPIFTTNYDPAIETFCDAHANEYALTDGFKHMHRDYVWDPETFHGFHFTPGKRSIVLFKLHGSVDWLLLRLKNAIIRSQPFHQSIDTKRYQNVLIYPAVHKVATDEPYYTAYDYYGRCCETARLLLTIGYSFRDYDALARLRSAMSFNSSLLLFLMAPDAVETLGRLPMDRERLRDVPYMFGSESDSDSYLSDVNSMLLTLYR